METLRRYRVQISRACLAAACVYLVAALYVHISTFYFHVIPPVLGTLLTPPWGLIAVAVFYGIAVWAGPTGYGLNPPWIQTWRAPSNRRTRLILYLGIGILWLIYTAWVVMDTSTSAELHSLPVSTISVVLWSGLLILQSLRPPLPAAPPEDYPPSQARG
jgi:hypothetical protein